MPTTLIWFQRLLVLGAIVAGATASAAGAVGRPPDMQDAASANPATQNSRPPDIRDAASAIASPAPDVIERAVAVASRHPDVRYVAVSPDTAAPDVVERFAAVHPYGLGLSSTPVSVSRPPDIADTALAVRYAPVAQSSSFQWTDWGIGIGTGMGIALLLVCGLIIGRQLRHRVQTV
jgi:hypothetical protein